MVNNWGLISLRIEIECKGNHKIPFLLVNFTTCYYLSRFSFRHNLSHSLLAQIELFSNQYI